MSINPKNLFWDSCVFIRYLTEHPSDHVGDIQQYIEQARAKEIKIHFSTLAFAEIRPRHLRTNKFGNIFQFFEDLGGSFHSFDANPNIMRAAGLLRDHEPVNPGDPNISGEQKRSIGLGDAVHLATCLFLRDAAGCDDIVFHTFDEGKGKGWEGRCVPLLGFEKWFPEEKRIGPVAAVCGLSRTKPIHPDPDLVTTARLAAMPAASPGTH